MPPTSHRQTFKLRVLSTSPGGSYETCQGAARHAARRPLLRRPLGHSASMSRLVRRVHDTFVSFPAGERGDGRGSERRLRLAARPEGEPMPTGGAALDPHSAAS